MLVTNSGQLARAPMRIDGRYSRAATASGSALSASLWFTAKVSTRRPFSTFSSTLGAGPRTSFLTASPSGTTTTISLWSNGISKLLKKKRSPA